MDGAYQEVFPLVEPVVRRGVESDEIRRPLSEKRLAVLMLGQLSIGLLDAVLRKEPCLRPCREKAAFAFSLVLKRNYRARLKQW